MPQASYAFSKPDYQDTPEDYAKLGTLGSTIRRGNAENIKAQTDAEQELAARKLLSQHISRGDRTGPDGKVIPAGQADETGYIAEATKLGLSPAAIRAAQDWNTANQTVDLDRAQNLQMLEMLGVDPRAAARNNASYGPPSVTVPNPDADPPAPPAPDKLTQLWDKAKSRTAPPAQEPPVAPGGAVAPTTAPGTDMGSLGSSSLATGTLPPLPEGAGASPTVLRPLPDTRSARQIMEDSRQTPTGDTTTAALSPVDGDYKRIFDYDKVKDVGGLPLKTAIDASLAKLAKSGQAGVNDLMRLADDSVTKPGIVYTGGKRDIAATMAAQREYAAKVQAARKQVMTDLASGNTGAIAEMLQMRDQALAQLKADNDITEKNVSAIGANSFADNVTKVGNAAGLPGTIDPTGFKTKDELDAFGKQATAYATMQKQLQHIGADGFQDPLETLTFAKNFTQAEGLGEAEGTRNLAMLLAARDPGTRMLLSSVMDKGSGAVNQAIQTVLMTYRPADLAKLADGMKFQADWANHTGTGRAPILPRYRNPGEQTAPGAAPSEESEEAVGARAELLQRLGLNGYRKAQGLPEQPLEETAPATSKAEALFRKAKAKPAAPASSKPAAAGKVTDARSWSAASLNDKFPLPKGAE